MATTRNATTTREGNLFEGAGRVELQSSGIGTFDVSWPARAEEPNGKTSPEELIAAAHSACFSMAFSNGLAKAGTPPERLDTTAAVTFALSRARARGRLLQEPGHSETRLVFIAPPIDVNDFVLTVARELGLSDRTRVALKELVERRIGQSLDDLRAVKLASSMREPLLVVHDEQDRAVPVECGQSLADAWPRASLRITRGLGHSRILRDESVIAEAARFLACAS